MEQARAPKGHDRDLGVQPRRFWIAEDAVPQPSLLCRQCGQDPLRESRPSVMVETKAGIQGVEEVLRTVQRGRNHVGARRSAPALGPLEDHADAV